MAHLTRTANRLLFVGVVGVALLSACMNTELAIGKHDAANPRAATTPQPALARLSSSSDAQPADPPTVEKPATHDDDMPGMKMGGAEMAPMAPTGTHAAHTGMAMGDAGKSEPAAQKKAAHWTCTMHPNIDLPKPGKCPICGMKLVPKTDDAVDGGAK